MTKPVWLVSIHDVMPDTIGVVRGIMDQLDNYGISPVTLLVVPGKSWSESDLAWLRTRQKRGDRLAGHGWIHRAGAPRGLFDRLHRRFFSRGVAEHLPLSADGISALIEKCHGWFAAQDLATPDLYVPPAWAMGSISREQLRQLPFRNYETLAGVYDATTDRFTAVPLVGFEADTAFRAITLRLSNVFNQVAAKWHGQLRVAIHPYDPQLRLRADLARMLEKPANCVAYGA